jgi:hypothetical protein
VVRHRPVESFGIWQEGKLAVEIAAGDDAVPEFIGAEDLFGFSRILPKQISGCGVEVGQDAVTI